MEENQTNQNLNQQPAQQNQVVQQQATQQQAQIQAQQQAQQQEQQVQQWQPVQQQAVDQPSVSMQIQQLLVQQQQYQKQYNELVDYVKRTPNLPIEQVNQIKAQLDHLNALFVQWKQQLQALWYNQIQINKPTEVKKWSRNNFSFKKLAIWCGVVLLLILTGFWVTLTSLIKNPDALSWIWVDASIAKIILQTFSALLLWSIIILMLWVVIANIYRLITVKNQSKKKYIWWLIWGLLWAIFSWLVMVLIFSWIWKIVTEVKNEKYDLVQPYLVWRVKDWDKFTHPYDNDSLDWIWNDYPLIAPSEMEFALRWNELDRLMNEIDVNYEIVSVTLSCGNKDDTVLELAKIEKDGKMLYKTNKNGLLEFDWTCLYSEKWEYTYSVNVTYDNKVYHQIKTEKIPWKSLNFGSDITLYKTSTTSSSSNSITTKLSSSNWEFILWKAPAKISTDSTQVFRDFSLQSYKVEWDMDWDFESDRVDQVTFDYSYNIPKIYYVTYKFPELSDNTRYRFPVRVEPSDVPVCIITAENFKWTTKYHITSDFIDPSDATKIDSYNYTIRNVKSRSDHEIMKDQPQEINYTFPEQWTYIVVLDYVTVDWKQWRCESEPIQMEKEKFDVQYSILSFNDETWKFKELCDSKSTSNKWCTEIDLDTVPHTYQLQIKSVSPYSNTLKKVVSLNGTSLLNENDSYTFDIPNEWVYELKITTSDTDRWMDEEEFIITFTAKKPDIVGNMTITLADTREPVTEGFEPLTVILDVSKTEINVPWDEIVYFSWDFGDWDIKNNQQNAVVAHTYNYDYKKENWIFQPKVTIHTLQQRTKEISWPILNIKKWLISVEISPTSHPSRQAPVWSDVTFSAEFDWLPEKMIWDFGDGTEPIECWWRNCTDITHTFEKQWLFSINLSLEFDAVQQVDRTIEFKVY